jgi:hypothetical protein
LKRAFNFFLRQSDEEISIVECKEVDFAFDVQRACIQK